MINTSPVDVHYSWGFLQQPPVARLGEAEIIDEGVDMESDRDSETAVGDQHILEQEVPEEADFSLHGDSSGTLSESPQTNQKVETVKTDSNTEEMEEVNVLGVADEVEVEGGEPVCVGEAEDRSGPTSSVAASGRSGSGSGLVSPNKASVTKLEPHSRESCPGTDDMTLFQKFQPIRIADEDTFSPISIQQVGIINLPVGGSFQYTFPTKQQLSTYIMINEFSGLSKSMGSSFINSFTKLMAVKCVWQIKCLLSNEDSLYIRTYKYRIISIHI